MQMDWDWSIESYRLTLAPSLMAEGDLQAFSWNRKLAAEETLMLNQVPMRNHGQLCFRPVLDQLMEQFQ